MLPESVSGYLARRGVVGGWRLELLSPGLYPGGIIVPALAESDNLPRLLASLTADPTLPESGLAVVVVVNNREDTAAETKDDNRRSLELLRAASGRLPFPLGLVDAASPGLALPERDGGVGLARKIGHDLLLPRLDYSGFSPVMVSLDADTAVAPGYAGAICTHFRFATSGGAIVPYRHLPADDPAGQQAIDRYELFLRCYEAGLAYAGSPYAFQTVGSAMACTAEAYVRCGGMNRRRAGEDFYFLQSLAKTAGVARIAGTSVYPSPRRSERVPFGTGRAMGALLDQEAGAVLFHRPESFRLLQAWLELAIAGCRERLPDLAGAADRLSPCLADYLAGQTFSAAWQNLLQHNQKAEQLLKAFHRWFDAFRTMKLLHYLADGPFPRCEPDEVLDLFPEAWGAAGLSFADRLELLRLQAGGK